MNGTAIGKDDDAESGHTQSVTTRGRGSNSPSSGGAGPAPREPHSKCPSLSPFHNTDSGEAFISHVMCLLDYHFLGRISEEVQYRPLV